MTTLIQLAHDYPMSLTVFVAIWTGFFMVLACFTELEEE